MRLVPFIARLSRDFLRALLRTLVILREICPNETNVNIYYAIDRGMLNLS